MTHVPHRLVETDILPALDATVTALQSPPADAALVRLAEVVALTIDEMEPGQRGMMLGQTAPLLLKILQELETRAVKRQSKRGDGRPNKVHQLRAAHAQATKGRRAG